MFYTKREKGNYGTPSDRNRENVEQDFFEKCYICERKLDHSGQIEHRIHKSIDEDDLPLLEEEWNIFWSCGRCNANGMKGTDYAKKSDLCKHGKGCLGIIDCTNCDPNKYISLDFDSVAHDERKYGEAISVEEKESAYCIGEFTIPLLKKVYGCKTKMVKKDLKRLLNEIDEECGKCYRLTDELRDKINEGARSEYIEKLKSELVWLIHSISPFSAFKRSHLEEMRRGAENGSGIKDALQEILSDTRLHPITNECSCLQMHKSDKPA
jgi:hypothetical protein